MRKLAEFFTQQSRQIDHNSAVVCFPFIQCLGAARPNSMVGLVPAGTSAPVAGLGGEARSVEQVMGPPNSCRGGLDSPAWLCLGFLQIRWQGRAGARPRSSGSLLCGVSWRQAAWGFRPQLWTTETGSTGGIRYCGTGSCRGEVARGAGCSYPGTPKPWRFGPQSGSRETLC